MEMGKPNWDIEIGASNTVKFLLHTRDEVLKTLRKHNYGARCSILTVHNNREIFYGTVGQAIKWLKYH